MISINGMISMRACFFGMGDRTLIIVPLVLRPAHRKCDGCAHFRDRARLESPAAKRAGRSVIQDRAPGTLGHVRARNRAAAGIDRHDTNAAARDLGTPRLVRILWPWSTDRDGFC